MLTKLKCKAILPIGKQISNSIPQCEMLLLFHAMRLRASKVLRVQRLNVSRTCGACFIASLFHGLRRVFEFLSRFRLNDCYLSRLTPQTIVSYLGYTSNDSYKVSVAKRLQNVYLCYTLAIPLQKLWKYHRAVNPTSNVTFFFSMAM